MLEFSVAETEPEPEEPKLFWGTRAGAVISYFVSGFSGSGAEINFSINILI